jgi:tRNA nucleotidyltransferase (CCA-adding enzyme)
MGRTRADLLSSLHRCLPDAARRALAAAVAAAGARRTDLYLVGGGVRDLLLGAPHTDADLLVEGDAIALAGAAAEALGARLTTHERFGTAVVAGAGYRLDFARARAERSEATSPGATSRSTRLRCG